MHIYIYTYIYICRYVCISTHYFTSFPKYSILNYCDAAFCLDKTLSLM